MTRKVKSEPRDLGNGYQVWIEAEVNTRWDRLKDWAPLVLRQRARRNEDWALRWHQRAWVTARCLAALVLDRTGDSQYGPEAANTDPVHWSHHEYGDAADWTVIKVPERLRDGLVYELVETGYP